MAQLEGCSASRSDKGSLYSRPIMFNHVVQNSVFLRLSLFSSPMVNRIWSYFEDEVENPTCGPPIQDQVSGAYTTNPGAAAHL